tara:strand:- start:841 stop:1257 length:417 start_codon:yes stop_codon:yes gene_type:complete
LKIAIHALGLVSASGGKWEQLCACLVRAQEKLTLLNVRMKSMTTSENTNDGRKQHEKRISDLFPDALIAEGFGDCILGMVEGFNQPMAVLYDKTKVLAKLQESMEEDEAVEYYEYNILGSYVGTFTPLYAIKMENLDG